MTVVFLDLETTGLDPERHRIWEIGLIEENGTEHQWFHGDIELKYADPTALRIGRFYERYPMSQGDPPSYGWDIAPDLVRLTAGQHIVGAVPSFDADFLSRFLRRNDLIPAWHYHLIDVEALVAGKLGIRPPWDSKALETALGLDTTDNPLYEKHTALGDARWARLLYDTVFA